MGSRKLANDARTKATLRKLGEWGATRDEAAAWLDVSRPTLWKFLNENPDCAHELEAGLDRGRVSLRRLQWRSAHNGNATMLIWLGKQLLKQYDQPPTEEQVTRESIEAMRIEFERKLASIAESDEKEKLASESDA